MTTKKDWINMYDDLIASFLRVEEEITDIILLGKNGGIRRICNDFEYGEETT